MRRLTTKQKLYLQAFLLPFVIYAVICFRNGVFPFGDNCILHVDMYHQYEPFFTEFMDKLKHGGSLLYSFRLGLGSDFVALFAYYLASPLNWLLFFCPALYVIEFMTILILVKIGLCSLTFVIYLRKRFGGADACGVLMGTFYALSGYMAAYYWNIMWLDVLVLTPLVVLGLWQLVREGRCRLYCISLAAAVLSNFYIAIMLCIFLVMIFAAFLLEETRGVKERLCCIGRFSICSLLAGGMGAVLILPEAAVLSYSGSAGISFPKTAEWYFDLVSMLARHCFSVAPYTGRDHWPNLYCGAAVFLFLVLYICNRSISRKKKGIRLGLIVFFWVGFSSNVLDFIWHGMHFPDSLPGRQSYLYIFLLLTMAYETYRSREGNRWYDVCLGIAVSGGFLTACYYLADSGMVSFASILLTGIFALLYGLLVVLWMIGPVKLREWVRLTACALAVVEIFYNTAETGISTTSRSSYTKNWESVKTLLKEVDETEDMPFYRVEETERLTKNDGAIYGYASSTIFSSLMNIGVSRFYRTMGMEGGKNFYSYSGATPLSSAMLSVKYLISGSPYEESPLRTLAAEDGQNYIYKNRYTLPLGFMADAELEADWNVRQGKSYQIDNLNRLAFALGAEEAMFVPIKGKVSAEDGKTRITVEEDGYLYGTYTDTTVTNITVTNKSRVRKFTKCDHGYILDLGWCKQGDVVEITASSDVSEFHVQPYRLQTDALDAAYETLNEQTMEIDSFCDTRIEGHISVRDSGNLLLSIPQEGGWSVWVDGKETKSSRFMDSLIKIPLIKGEHEILLTYHTPGLKTGAGISLASLALFLLLFVFRKKKPVIS